MKPIRNFYRRLKRLVQRLPEWLQLSLMGIIALGFFGVGGVVAWAAFMPIPSITNFENRQVSESTKIYDRTGNIVLYDVHGSVRRTTVPLEAISPYIQKATIAIEDASFYEHNGFRPLAFLRAVWTNFTTGDLLGGQGGSTITQQVVKNALLTQKKTPTRKLQEIILAIRLERIVTKDQILATYLNENPYGGTIYGVEEASNYFFGVTAADVDLAQAAYLAALPQAPTRYSPYGNNRDLLERRKNLVLARMLEHGFINQDEYEEATNETVQFKDAAEAGIKAPHFVFFVREYLESKYGVDAVQRDGLRAITTLDYELQQKAEDVVSKYAPSMEKNFRATNEGMVAVEPTTGQILAMVGSRGYFDDTIDGKVNVSIAHRQPGSSFKPIVYAAALEKGYTPETMVFDLRTQYSTRCAPQNLTSEPPCYSPESFDGKFRGPVTFRDALAQSLNNAAVKVLYLVGIDNALTMASRLGITTLGNAGQYGLTLVLGGGEVSLLEMTGAYSVFANEGVRNPPTAILRVEDKRGNVLENYENKGERVIEPQVARQVSDILSDNAARTPEFGANSPLNFPGKNIADKTGTTNDFHDVWIIGYTPGISVGAWAGNNDNTAMEKRIASFIIAPMWHEFMDYATDKYPAADFVPPSPEPEESALPPVLRGNWNTNPTEGIHEILHWINKDNPRGGRPTNPYADGQYANWEYPVQLWAGQQMFGTTTSTGTASFTILSPAAGSTVPAGVPIQTSAYHPFPQNIMQVSYFLNDALVGSANQPPYAVSFVPMMRGPVLLRAVAQTALGTEINQISLTIQ